jgi:uncharacterized protein YkwD
MSINNKPTFADALINLISSTFKTYLPVIILVLLGLVGGYFYRNYEVSHSLTISKTSNANGIYNASATSVEDAYFSQQDFAGLLNQARINAGLNPLKDENTLDLLALAHVKDEIARNYYSHTTPDGVTAVQRIDNAFQGNEKLSAEIEDEVCYNNGTQDEFNRFMASPEHKATMMDPRLNYYGAGFIESKYGWCNGHFVMDFIQI